jgi:hypothetical protein
MLLEAADIFLSDSRAQTIQVPGNPENLRDQGFNAHVMATNIAPLATGENDGGIFLHPQFNQMICIVVKNINTMNQEITIRFWRKAGFQFLFALVDYVVSFHGR